jgi:hypothetical protein
LGLAFDKKDRDMVIVPLLVVLAVVALVQTVRRYRAHAMAAGGVLSTEAHAAPLTAVGRWSLVVLGAAFIFWSLTFTTLPIYYAAAIGGTSLVLAVVASVRDHDRSPFLLIPLNFVPLAALLSAAFVLLQ